MFSTSDAGIWAVQGHRLQCHVHAAHASLAHVSAGHRSDVSTDRGVVKYSGGGSAVANVKKSGTALSIDMFSIFLII